MPAEILSPFAYRRLDRGEEQMRVPEKIVIFQI
jgi:hypothetical protein